MCEIALCVHDRGTSGVLAVDCKAFKAGDVMVVVPDGSTWGECDLGGPTYTAQIVQVTKTTFSILIPPEIDLSQVMEYTDLAGITGVEVTRGAPIIVDGSGAAFGASNFQLYPALNSATLDYYDHQVIGTQVLPIAQHPNGNHSYMRIIKLPSVTMAQANHLMTPEIDTNPLDPSPYLQPRGFFIDKTKIPVGMAALAAHIADDLRTNQSITLANATAAQINALVTQRPPIPKQNGAVW